LNTNRMLPNALAERAEPETFRARTLSATLAVKDIQKSLVWYRDKVGFIVDKKFERSGKLNSVLLKAGNMHVLLTQDDGGTGWDKVKGAGFSLHFTTAQDIEGLAQAIKERGGVVNLEKADALGGRVLRLRDPDGFTLLISAAS
jgi:catechol 2,3-dioxygenase-like lactoylglutathione lyase family enzyme